jgi:hypothetical protein
MIDSRTAPYATLLLRTLDRCHRAPLLEILIRAGHPDGWWTHPTTTAIRIAVWYAECGIRRRDSADPGYLHCQVALYCLPLMLAAAQYWLVRTGFFFTAAGAELRFCGRLGCWCRRAWAMARCLVPSSQFPLLGRSRAHA